MFLNGYQFARRQLKLPLSHQEQEFREFQPWLQSYLNMQTTQSWSNMILMQAADEADAFARFFTLFDLFLQEQRNQLQTNGQTTSVKEARQS